MVSLVKQNLHCTTLAIGDGANDVSMIQAADVGVGIAGHEGLQAARSSDYAIGQFRLAERTRKSTKQVFANFISFSHRYLQKLLFVHGQLSYQRLSKVILFSFYKTLTLYLVSFYFSFLNGFSGQLPWDRISNILWNVLYTLFGVISIGIFEQDLSPELLMKYPELYQSGQRNDFVRSLFSLFLYCFQFNCLFYYDFTTIIIFSSTSKFSLAGSSIQSTIPWFASQYSSHKF